jgi:P4 family phage/plasmid primase-like protien
MASGTASYKDLQDFLTKHNAKPSGQGTPTHTRIPDKALNIYGGAFSILPNELDTFFALYYNDIFVKNKMEYLTEKQLEVGGPVLVDFDFRYHYDVESRKHTQEHVQDMVILYLEELKELLLFTANVQFSVYIMEKPHVNRLEDKSLTKDGIHMLIGVQMDSTMQVMLRSRMLKKLPEIWGDDLPLINGWDAVLDEGISKGKTNWQLFGSRKPGNEKYELTQHFIVEYDESDGQFMLEEKRVLDFNLEKNLIKLSAQYTENPKFEINPAIINEYNKLLGETRNRPKLSLPKTKIRLLESAGGGMLEDENGSISLQSITNKEILKKAMDNILQQLMPTEFYIKETHEYAQTLPEKYYEPGSHLLNRMVAFALKDTDERLFLSWVMLRSKASDFDYATIPALYEIWRKNMSNDKTNGVTRRSIMFWSKQDAREDFEKVKNNNVDKYVEDSLNSPTDYDFAMALYYMYKDRYVCVDMSTKPIWYRFNGHRWEPDKGDSLRLCISREMYHVYNNKSIIAQLEYTKAGDDQDKAEACKKKSSYISKIALQLKNTSSKNNVMKEAAAIFYDVHFIKNMDANKWLMCFNNGVIDFKTKEFRNGYPQDYITKSTCIDYVPFDSESPDTKKMANEIYAFMEQLFPVQSLNKYMWDHLASCLIGINKNQTFNIYRGDGSNGKSKMTDLMTYALGDYKGTVPITLVSEKRNSIGGTCSEVMQLKGLRYAVMQEPSKDTPLNEGVMKELTGGDPIQGRKLYMESETFIPQFKLCVCTNSLFEIKSNDNGTWRRIRICDFMSTFVDKIDESENAPPYQFLKDKDLEDKLRVWAPLFASMLVKRAFDTNGEVEDCDIVLASSNKYRQGQDIISAFISEIVIKTGVDTDRIKKKELQEQFKQWFQETHGMRKAPKGSEVEEQMDKRFGKANKFSGWHNVKILYNQEVMEDLV